MLTRMISRRFYQRPISKVNQLGFFRSIPESNNTTRFYKRSYLISLGIGLLSSYLLYNFSASAEDDKASLFFSSQIEEKLISIADSFLAGEANKAYYELYLLSHYQGCEKLKVLVEYIEYGDYIEAKKYADSLFVQHKKLAQRYQVILSKIYGSIQSKNNSVEGPIKNFIPKYYNEYLVHQAQYNKVVIRVWKPTTNKSVGHVSIQTEKHYISFWPGNINSPEKKNLHSLIDDIRTEQKLPDYRITLISLDVNTLNSEYENFLNSGDEWHLWASSIFKAKETHNCCSLSYLLLNSANLKELTGTKIYKDLFNDMTYGGIFGLEAARFLSNLTVPTVFDPFLTYHPLFFAIRGGLLLSTFNSAKKYSLVTPDNIGKLVEYAKEQEIERYSFYKTNMSYSLS